MVPKQAEVTGQITSGHVRGDTGDIGNMPTQVHRTLFLTVIAAPCTPVFPLSLETLEAIEHESIKQILSAWWLADLRLFRWPVLARL